MKGKVKTIAVFLVFALLFNIFAPTMSVIAVEYGTGNKTLSIDFTHNDTNFSVYDVTVNGDTHTNNEDVFKTSDGQYSILGKIKSLDASKPCFQYGGNIREYMESQTISIAQDKTDATISSFSITLNDIGTAVDDENNIINFIGLNVDADGGGNQNSEKITFQLDGATVSENVITFTADSTEITATVSGTGYSFNGNNLLVHVADINNVKLALSNNFDNSKMSLKLHDGQTLMVTGEGEAIFDGLDFSHDASPHLGLYLDNNDGGNGDNTQNYHGNATATLNYSIIGSIEYTSGGGFDHGISFKINDIPYKADESKMQYSEGTAYERDEHGQYILNENNEKIPVLDPETMQHMTEKTGLTIVGDTIHYDSQGDSVDFVFTDIPILSPPKITLSE